MNKSFYFQHDYNAANDHKILYLRQQLGIEGYGIFWYVIEQLSQSGGKLPLKIIPVLAMQIQTTPDKVKSVVCNYELFEIENEFFFSLRLNQQIEFRQQLSIEGKAGAAKRWLNYNKNSPPISPPNSTPYAKERKGKERKGEIEKETIINIGKNTSGKYILINPPYANQNKYRIYGVDGLSEYLEMMGSKLPRTDYAEKFMREKDGHPFNDFGHVLSSYNLFIEKQYK